MPVLLPLAIDGHETGFDPALPVTVKAAPDDPERLAVCREAVR